MSRLFSFLLTPLDNRRISQPIERVFQVPDPAWTTARVDPCKACRRTVRETELRFASRRGI